MKKKKERYVVLRGGVVLSTGKEIPVEVRLRVPKMTRKETVELQAASVALHDLSPDTERSP